MKKICSILMLFVLSFIMTGCVKFNANMNIDKDKSMDFDIIYAVDTTFFGDEGLNFDDEEIQKLKDTGFEVNDYSEGTMKGVKLSRSVTNIDLVSSTEDIAFSLSNLMNNDDGSNKALFKLKKGLLKNTYTAKFEFNSSDSSLGDSISGDENVDTEEVYDEDEVIIDDNEDDFFVEDDTTVVEDEVDTDMDFDPSLMMGAMDLSFNVNLPYAAISNNASEVLNEGKTLKWNMMGNGQEEFIEFEFELYNMMTIYIGIGIVVVLVIVIVFLILKKFGKKKNNNNNVQQNSYQSIQNNVNDLNQNTTGNVLDNVGIQNNNFMDQHAINNQGNNMNNGLIDNNNVLMNNNDVLQNDNIPQQVIPQSIMNGGQVNSQMSQIQENNIIPTNNNANNVSNINSQMQANISNVMDMKPNMSLLNEQNNGPVQGNNMMSTNNNVNNIDNINSQMQASIPNVMDMKPNMPLMNEQNNGPIQGNNMMSTNNNANNVSNINSQMQASIPNVMDMKPNMPLMNEQNNGPVQGNNMMSTNNNANNVSNINSQMQSNISSMNFVSGQNNQNMNQ